MKLFQATVKPHELDDLRFDISVSDCVWYLRANTVEDRQKWIDTIDQIVQNYNNTPHSAHGLKPVDVTEEKSDELYKKMYPERNLTVICKLKVGDKVRKIREKTLFEKGYTQNWSDEIYKIVDVRQSNGICWYILRTLANEEVTGIWYYYQLNLVSRDVGENQRENIE